MHSQGGMSTQPTQGEGGGSAQQPHGSSQAYSTTQGGSPGVALEIATSDAGTIRTLAKAMVCLARTGEELMVEATRDKVSFRAINSAKTGFLMVDMASTAFDIFAPAGETYHCKVSGKSLQLAFKSLKNLQQMEMLFDHDASMARVTMTLRTGAQKCYSVSFIEGDIMSVGFSKDQCTHNVRSRPQGLSDVLQNMHKDELKIQFARDMVAVHGFSEVALDASQKAIVTTINYESRDFDSYNFNGGRVDLIFAMKEFRSFLELCDGLGIHFCMHFSEGGQPLIFAGETEQGERLTIEMVVATVVHDETASQMSQSTMGSQSSMSRSQSSGYRSDSGYASSQQQQQQQHDQHQRHAARPGRADSQSQYSQSSDYSRPQPVDHRQSQYSQPSQSQDGWTEQDRDEQRRYDDRQQQQQQQQQDTRRRQQQRADDRRDDGAHQQHTAADYDRRQRADPDRGRAGTAAAGGGGRRARPRSPEFDDDDEDSDTYSLEHQRRRSSNDHAASAAAAVGDGDDETTLRVEDDDVDEFVECTPPDEDGFESDQSVEHGVGGGGGGGGGGSDAGEEPASLMIGMTPQEADDESSRESLPMM